VTTTLSADALANVAAPSAGDARGAHLVVELITTLDGLARLEQEWTALVRRVSDAPPFMTHEWATAWWTHLRNAAPGARDALRVFVVRDANRTPVAIAPYVLTVYGALGVVAARLLQPMGADPNLTEVRGILVAPDDEAAAVAALRDAIASLEPAPDWIRFAGVRRDGDAYRVLRALPGAVCEREFSTFVLRLPNSWEEFKRSRPRNVRESLRKCYNSLARDGHEWHLRVVDSAPAFADALSRLYALHARRAVAGGSVAHPDYFAPPRARAFLDDVVQRFARRGAVVVFQLHVGADVVATRLGFRSGDELYLYYSGYDPAWGKYSVMTTTVAEALRHAIETGATRVNLSTGADVSKTRWRPEERPLADLIVVSPRPRARIVHAAFRRVAKWKAERRRRALDTRAGDARTTEASPAPDADSDTSTSPRESRGYD